MVRYAFLVILACACSRNTAEITPAENAGALSKPATATTPTPPKTKRSACAAHKKALRKHYCESETTEEPCPADSFVCELRLDFNGDGKMDRVAIEALGTTSTLMVYWAGGTQERLASSAQPLELAQTGESFKDFAWLVHWKVLVRKNEGFSHRGRKLPVKGMHGDGLFVSGGDAAGVVFQRKGSFVMEHLGF
ncbi:MAG: hypothetical protein JRH20_26020 [Deltaproteobacteria bacterium]|nr:hypothetical protein [Deltaproteobacteria bacterium]